ncbi:MAG: diguanylate cyclase [Proteobacteria bacterium]|nr:diguanylate cyclase [Pseudomonadota bacterium]
MRVSLRVRLAIGLALTVLSFGVVLLVGLAVSYLPVFAAIDDIVEEVTEEITPLHELQRMLLLAAMPVNDYQILPDPAERAEFARLGAAVERAFAAANVPAIDDPTESEMLASARRSWREARELGELLLAGPPAPDESAPAADMRRFDALITDAVGLLDQAQVAARRELDADVARIRGLKESAFRWLLGAIGLGLVAAFLVAVALAGSILEPVGALREGARRFAADDFRHRVRWRGHDEFADLARTFNRMADEIAQDREVLEGLALRDPLTGLLNRRGFEARLAEEVGRCRRYGRPLSLAMLDLDHFKKVNDTYGHPVGDEVLAAVAARLTAGMRGNDIAARYGGEEFIVLLPETTAEAALTVAERLRRRLAETPVATAAGRALPVTVSIGVAAFPGVGEGAEALIAAADRALYAAKEAGRNRVVRAGPAERGGET